MGSGVSENTNNIHIKVNTNSTSGESNEETQDDGNRKDNEEEKGRKLAERIKSVVIEVINEEQRPGGSLPRKQ